MRTGRAMSRLTNAQEEPVLAAYWLPVPPGWLSWRLLQRKDYI
jgi:hypothetical protein